MGALDDMKLGSLGQRRAVAVVVRERWNLTWLGLLELREEEVVVLMAKAAFSV